MNACEYCQEIHSPRESRFGRIYAGACDGRVLLRTRTFIVMPTLGQLFRGSVLILPAAHVETLAGLSPEETSELASLLSQVQDRLREFGHPIFMEHGSAQEAAGSCGIYHAHLHVIPLPTPVRPHELLPSAGTCFATLEKALEALGNTRQYLLAGDGTEVIATDVDSLAEAPGSQYFRRKLVSRFDLDRSWDWRHADEPEDDLLTTVEAFGVRNVAQPA